MWELVNGERMLRKKEPSYTVSSPQVIYDTWRKVDRIMRFTGFCRSCHRRCYEFDDGENDPRGMLGDNAGCNLSADEFDMVGKDIICCFLCQNNDEATYNRIVAYAKKRWKERIPLQGDPFPYVPTV